MIMDKIKLILEDNLTTPFDYTKIYGLEYCAEEILNLLIPTLNWTDRSEMSYSSGGGYMCVIRKTDNNYTTTVPEGFTGTLAECKHYCSMWVRNEYLKLCDGNIG